MNEEQKKKARQFAAFITEVWLKQNGFMNDPKVKGHTGTLKLNPKKINNESGN